ncbi:MAG: TrkA family potassium uptake protein [Eubacteriales bacterium]|nr:TrkA family potassium uptake protein [Eubacteriales bacterium]
MKIAVAGGRDEADFLIGLLLMGKHRLTAINGDRKYCEHLAADYEDVSVIYGDPGKDYVMEDAGVRGADIVIALTDRDADNLEICQMAKRLFGVKKTVCTVRNPKNVEIFEVLGVDRAISATYMLAHYIEQASVVEELVKVMPMDNQKVLMNEIKVRADYEAVGKQVMELSLPHNTIISCIIRDLDVLVPNGQTRIMAGDRLVVMTVPQNQQDMLRGIMGDEHETECRKK